jgi:hypothetical protein
MLNSKIVNLVGMSYEFSELVIYIEVPGTFMC